MRGTLFLNPAAGRRAPQEVDEIARVAADAGLEVVRTGAGVDVPAAVGERRAAGCRLFIAAGGDGTLHHVVQGVAGNRAELGVVPIGTYNNFARDLGLPMDWREALDVALSGALVQVDTGVVNGRIFVNNLSLGLYPELVGIRESRGRSEPRWKAVAVAMVATYRRFPHVSLVLELADRCESIRTHLFVVSNNGYDLARLGFAAPRLSLEEGRLNVYWLPHVPKVRLIRLLARYVRGRPIADIRSLRTTHLRVSSGRPWLSLGIDGELFRIPPPLRVSIAPRNLLVRVPRPE